MSKEKAVQVSEDEARLLEVVKGNPQLLSSFLEMAEICGARLEEFETGDDAEDATVEAMHNTANVVLQGWVQKRCRQVEEEYTTNKECRPHEKKRSLGKHL